MSRGSETQLQAGENFKLDNLVCKVFISLHYRIYYSVYFQFKSQVNDLLKPEHDDFHLKKWLKGKRTTICTDGDYLRALYMGNTTREHLIHWTRALILIIYGTEN